MAAKKHKNYDVVFEYANSIVSGKKVACFELIQGCQRFLDDLNNPGYDFDPKDAEFVIGIIEKTFVHAQGEAIDGTPLRGKTFQLEQCHKFHEYNQLGIFHKWKKNRRFK